MNSLVLGSNKNFFVLQKERRSCQNPELAKIRHLKQTVACPMPAAQG